MGRLRETGRLQVGTHRAVCAVLTQGDSEDPQPGSEAVPPPGGWSARGSQSWLRQLQLIGQF